MDMSETNRNTAQRSSRVAWNITTISATQMLTQIPTRKVGRATASDGHMRWDTSVVMSRPLSERPKSKANRRSDLLKKMVSVTVSSPLALSLMNSGLS